MAERPILFNTAMVRALLAGTKTQTRRVVKPQPLGDKPRSAWFEPGVMGWAPPEIPSQAWHRVRCPYGQPGDRLWVREAHWWFKDEPDHSCGYYPPKLTAEDVEYRADGEKSGRVWRPSIHMPRWASRILLEVTAVRVERLQDISESDAIAEGITTIWPDGPRDDGGPNHYTVDVDPGHLNGPTAATVYRMLWELINGEGSWDANPWVWVVEFKRVTP